MSSTWKTLRVVVEVPAQDAYSARDLKRAVEQMMPGRVGLVRNLGDRHHLGKIQVKELNASLLKKLVADGKREEVNVLKSTIDRLNERLSRLEMQPFAGRAGGD